jgi:hypothetical protein
MSVLRSIAGGLRSLFRKERVEEDLDEKLRGFLEMAAEEKMKEGMSRKDALRAVRLERGASKSRRKSSALPAGNLFSRPCCGTRATRSDACEWLQHSPSPRC